VELSDGLGGAIIAWEDYRTGFTDIYVQKVNAIGDPQWTAGGVALCTATNDQEYVQITSDGAGGAIVTWQDSRDGDYDIYAQRIDVSGTVQWTANGVIICNAADYQYGPVITTDGGGGAIIAWQDYRAGNYDIYTQRVNPSGAVQWTANGVVLCSLGGNENDPAIVSDGVGGAIVAWVDNQGSHDDIFAQRVDMLGAIQWTVNGTAVCVWSGDQNSPSLASDGASGAIVVWEDTRSGNTDIYAQRLDATGAYQ
jgi:predicted lipoprotein with Yx(FWY)xxD motif